MPGARCSAISTTYATRPWQGMENTPDLTPLGIGRSSRGEIPENPKIVIWLDPGPAFSQQTGVHRGHVRERAVAKANDIVVRIVGIRGEPVHFTPPLLG